MQGGLTDYEWLALGDRACRIRDTITNTLVAVSRRFNVADKINKSMGTLDNAFSVYRSSLDDFICGAHDMSIRTIGPDHILITRVFYRPSNIVDEDPVAALERYSKKQRPRTLTEMQVIDCQNLWKDISALMADVQTYPYLRRRFAEKTHRRVLNRMKKCLNTFKSALDSLK